MKENLYKMMSHRSRDLEWTLVVDCPERGWIELPSGEKIEDRGAVVRFLVETAGFLSRVANEVADGNRDNIHRSHDPEWMWLD